MYTHCSLRYIREAVFEEHCRVDHDKTIAERGGHGLRSCSFCRARRTEQHRAIGRRRERSTLCTWFYDTSPQNVLERVICHVAVQEPIEDRRVRSLSLAAAELSKYPLVKQVTHNF